MGTADDTEGADTRQDWAADGAGTADWRDVFAGYVVRGRLKMGAESVFSVRSVILAFEGDRG